jgi:transposase InsO family protein
MARLSQTNQVWVADFSYVCTWAGFSYVAFIVDVFAHKIVSSPAATDKRTDLVLTPLRIALGDRDRHGHPRRARSANPSPRRGLAVHRDPVYRALGPGGHHLKPVEIEP